MHFRNFSSVRVFTHGRNETPYGFTVGDLDDFVLSAVAAALGFQVYRLVDTDPDAVRERWGAIPDDTLHVVGDFAYPVTKDEEDNVVVFDHHTTGDDERCSVHRFVEELVAQGVYPRVPAIMSQISDWDVRGPQAVPPESRPDPVRYLAVLGAEPEPYMTAVVDDVEDTDTADDGLVDWLPADAICVCWALHAAQSLREFVDLIVSSPAIIGTRARANCEIIKDHLWWSLMNP